MNLLKLANVLHDVIHVALGHNTPERMTRLLEFIEELQVIIKDSQAVAAAGSTLVNDVQQVEEKHADN